MYPLLQCPARHTPQNRDYTVAGLNDFFIMAIPTFKFVCAHGCFTLIYPKYSLFPLLFYFFFIFFSFFLLTHVYTYPVSQVENSLTVIAFN